MSSSGQLPDEQADQVALLGVNLGLELSAYLKIWA